MPMWCANSSVTVEPHLHLDKPSSVQAVVQSTMPTWPAMGQRHTWLTAPILVLELTIAVTMKMQVWCVLPQVSWMVLLMLYVDVVDFVIICISLSTDYSPNNCVVFTPHLTPVLDYPIYIPAVCGIADCYSPALAGVSMCYLNKPLTSESWETPLYSSNSYGGRQLMSDSAATRIHKQSIKCPGRFDS